MSTTPATPDPDAQAMASICEELTTQVRRIADALTTPVVEAADDGPPTTVDYDRRPACDAVYAYIRRLGDVMPTSRIDRNGIIWHAVKAGLDAYTAAEATTPATTCSARYTGVLPVGDCIRAAGHIPVTDHTDDRGRKWGDSLAEYPIVDAFGYAERERTGRNAGLTIPAQAPVIDDVTCRRMETRTCPPSYNGPCGERPCARFESDDPTPWLDTSTDEDAARTARRDSLRDLVGGGERIALSRDDTALLRRHVDAEIREHDTARAVAAEEERLRFALAAERDRWKERSRGAGHERDIIAADLDTAVRLRAEAQRDRDQHAAVLGEVLAAFVHKVEGYRIPRHSAEADVATLEKWRSVLAPTVERPWWEQVALYEKEAVEATRHVLELKAAIERVRSVDRQWAPKLLPHSEAHRLLADVRTALGGSTETKG